MSIKNQAMLITYADSLGKNLQELREVLERHLEGVVGGIHILPFYPSSGDRGFAPMDYTKVDPAFGDWDDLEAISRDYYFMTDFMVNHISRQSPYFQDFLKKKEASDYRDLFIRYENFWPKGEPSAQDVALIYKRKPRAPYVTVDFEDGTTEKVWCTFDEEQIDLDVTTECTRQFITDQLTFLANKGADIIRLDAFAYANKKVGTNCFFVEPNIWDLLSYCHDVVKPHGSTVLPEIHEHYTIQQKIAKKDYYVYDFALPMLVLHAIYSGTAHRLKNWLEICPRQQFTTLDTHDGIGVVDVKDLLSDEEVEETRAALYSQGANVKKIYSSEAYNNLDIYQINCTYYSALGNNDRAYILARAIQCFAPGIPQIYYVGLLAGKNDIELLEQTKEGRNINRHYYDLAEIDKEVQRPIVQAVFEILQFRNSSPAFDGEFSVELEDNILVMQWSLESVLAKIVIDMKTQHFTITEMKEITATLIMTNPF
ncbi:sucrose phosphorylase [Vagococcus sp. BWB3-3]|uniref:Sucrose phosphorylase n=1 Tax=Vagococcus allomyrinae TaxID=2794353 RepID=A0A940PD82_9ENTE|nr:sucrose phosphorylase [Vagococcus allomyrinae]MBP1042670.1 sucrose phosphorylase [Vagococcus allomyrinae]